MEEIGSSISERRRLTRSTVFHYLYNSSKPKTKLDIARDLNLSLPTVYQNISELMNLGLIEYCGTQKSTGGRPPVSLQVVSNAKCAIGISISSHRLRFLLTDLSRKVIAYKDFRHTKNVETDEYKTFLANELDLFIDENGIDRSKLLGVGISIAGTLPPDQSKVLYAPTLYLRNLSLQGLKDVIPFPVIIENDATCGGFAEWFNSGKRESIAYLSLGEGIGGAVLVNGNQYAGDHNKSGEFGHMCVEWNGKRCACGQKGCLEAYCSASRFQEELNMSAEEFFSELKQGNSEVEALWEDYKKHLTIAIHNIRMSLDCDVVLGGYLSEYVVPYIGDLRIMLSEADPFESNALYLRIGKYPKYSTMLGAGLFFIRDFLAEI